jgi:hypothetical protein
MVSYLKDTNLVEVYDGSGWQNFTGDITAVTAGTALTGGGTSGAVTLNVDQDALFTDGISGFTMVSGGTAGVTYQPISPNYIINSAFDIWQRGTSFTLANAFFADRWIRYTASGAAAITREAFSAGEIEAIGFGDATFYQKMDFTTGANFQGTAQRVEDVKTLSGQTVTISFWAKGTNPGTGAINVYLDQDFGSGGSGRVRNLSTSITITADWQRYTVTGTLGSMTGKTIGANNYLEVTFRQTGVSSDAWELNLWGVQLEAGSVATPFRRNANSIQGELAACQRYFRRIVRTDSTLALGVGMNTSTTRTGFIVPHPVEMRAAPSFTTSGSFTVRDATYAELTVTGFNYFNANEKQGQILPLVASGLVTGNVSLTTAAANAYLDFSAEL